MEPIQIRAFDKPLDMRLTGKTIVLPAELQAKIDSHWQDLLRQNPALRNGEVFTVSSVDEDAEAIHIKLDETSYAHYLYSRQVGDLGEYAIRVIHPAALILSSDDKMIFGSMGSHTSIADTIQCCGGGIDRRAVSPDGIVTIDSTIISELAEELGITAHDERVISTIPTYLKFGGPTGKMTLVYVVKLNATGEQFTRDYEVFAQSLKAKGEQPEFDEIFCIDNTTSSVDAFTELYRNRLNEYMAILLQTVADGLQD